jgi:hypothetical protein
MRKPDAFALLRHLSCAAQRRYHLVAQKSAGQQLHHGITMFVASSLKRCLTIFYDRYHLLQPAFYGTFNER